MDTNTIEKIICQGIKNNPETMEFLRGEALAIFNISRLEWIAKQDSEEDLNNPDLWDEFVLQAKRKFEKYVFKWFGQLSDEISFTALYKQIPYSIMSIFSSLIEEALSYAMFYEISIPLIEEIYERFRNENLCSSCC